MPSPFGTGNFSSRQTLGLAAPDDLSSPHPGAPTARHRHKSLHKVHITITREITGQAQIVPFSHADGLQMYYSRGVKTDQCVIYRVPSYRVRIHGGSNYHAIRFGLRNRGEHFERNDPGRLPPPLVRVCDCGLSSMHQCLPGWNGTYSPHSFQGHVPGAWRLFPGRVFYIHEGPVRGTEIAGSLGCVEILDGAWADFLQEIQLLANAKCAAIGHAGLLHVTIEHAPVPSCILD
jgi:hypothetical protein